MIERDDGCMRGFLWRVKASLPPEQVIGRLSAQGFKHTDHRVFSVLSARQGHKVIVVHSTGRVQIRLDWTTPYTERRSEALRIAQNIISSERHTENTV